MNYELYSLTDIVDSLNFLVVLGLSRIIDWSRDIYIFVLVLYEKFGIILKSWNLERNRNEDYRYCKFVKFPSWVGMVPENWLE